MIYLIGGPADGKTIDRRRYDDEPYYVAIGDLVHEYRKHSGEGGVKRYVHRGWVHAEKWMIEHEGESCN